MCYAMLSKFNTKKEQMRNIFSTYVTPKIKEINHPEILQEWKLNIDAEEYERNMAENYKPSKKRKLIVLLILTTGLHQ